MNITTRPGGLVELSVADPANILIDTRTDSHPAIRRVTIAADDVDHWTEAAPPAYDRAAYEARTEQLIRERYTVGAELAILRQRDSKPDEFAAYNAFAEQCKAEAKNELIN